MDSNVQRILDGQDIVIGPDIDAERKQTAEAFHAKTEAIRIIDQRIRVETNKAAKTIRDSFQPDRTRIMKKLLAGLAAAHEANAELFAFERALLNSGVEFSSGRPAFLGVPTDKNSELADFFRQAIADGHMSKSAMSREFR